MIHNSDVVVVDRTINRSEISYDDAMVYDYGAIDNDVMRFRLTISDETGAYLSPSIIRALSSWLLSPTEPKWLSFTQYNDSGSRTKDPVYKNVDYKGRFIRSTYNDIGAINKIAISFEFENVSPYAFTPMNQWTYSGSGGATQTLVVPGTNVGRFVSPLITIHSNADQTVEIFNQSGNTAAFSLTIPANTDVLIADNNCYY